MKNIKDITISIFAIIGFIAIVSGFTNNETETENQQMYATPESHVWKFYVTAGRANYLVNSVTGEIRLFKGAEADRHYWGIDTDKNKKD